MGSRNVATGDRGDAVMPVLVLFSTIILIVALPKPADPILGIIVTYAYVFIALIGICILTYQYGWDK